MPRKPEMERAKEAATILREVADQLEATGFEKHKVNIFGKTLAVLTHTAVDTQMTLVQFLKEAERNYMYTAMEAAKELQG